MSDCDVLNGRDDPLAQQHASVCRYLSTAADACEATRRQLWSVPEGVTAAGYASHVEALRPVVAAMLGYPPPGAVVAAAPALAEMATDDDATFYRVSVELLATGLSAFGLLIKPHRPAVPAKPLAVVVHGGGGYPELAAGIAGPSNYNEMGMRFARRGHVVWMPACHERVSLDGAVAPHDVHRTLDLRARLVGTSLAAIDAYSIIASTARLLSSAHCVPPSAIAAGLSYGGFRAQVVCALSPLFRGCVSSCFFNDRRSVLEHAAENGGFADLYFPNLLATATDVEMCGLVCPRPLFVEVGADDPLFPAAGALRAAAEVRQLYRSLGVEERFEFDVFEGGHEFSGAKAFAFLDRVGL